jgi:hypothetical protein
VTLNVFDISKQLMDAEMVKNQEELKLLELQAKLVDIEQKRQEEKEKLTIFQDHANQLKEGICLRTSSPCKNIVDSNCRKVCVFHLVECLNWRGCWHSKKNSTRCVFLKLICNATSAM